MRTNRPFHSPLFWIWLSLGLHLLVLALARHAALGPSLWGANASSFLGAGGLSLAAIGAVAVALLALAAPPFPAGAPARLGASLLGLPVFLVLKDDAHLLGDGRLWVSVLGGARVYHAHEPLAFAAARLVTAGVPAGDATAVAGRLETFSVLLGVAALYLLFLIAAELAVTPRGRWTAFGLLLTSGTLQFGAGYVEAYPVFWVALLLLAWSALRVERGAAPAALLGGAAGLAAGIHGMGLLTFPAVAWLLLRRRLAARAWALAALAAAVPVVVGYGLLAYILPSAQQMSEGVETTAGGVRQILRGLRLYPYGPTAWGLDQLNRWSLAAPLAVPLLVGGWLTRGVGSATGAAEIRAAGRRNAVTAPLKSAAPLFFLAVGLSLVLPGLVLDTEAARGAAVDWDAFAVATVPLTILSAALWGPRLDRDGRLARPAAVAVGVGLLGTLAFMSVNADPKTAAARFESLARSTFRTPRARAWGFEALATWRRDSGDLGGALEAYERALAAMPKHPRLLANTATLYSRGNRHAEAARLFARVTQATPGDYSGWFFWAVESEIIGRFDDAERGYRGALGLNAKSTDALMGLARVRLRSSEGVAEARDLLIRSLEIAPNQPHAAEIRRTLSGLNPGARTPP